MIQRWPNGRKRIEFYRDDDGHYHKDNGPAHIEYYKCGKIYFETYF